MNNHEQLLHYVWKMRLIPHDTLKTVDGFDVEVLDPGIHNSDAGPDFFNAKIRIGDKVWAGNIEIHHSSSDWVSHGHHRDEAYNSVILHLAERVNSRLFNSSGVEIPQCEITLPPQVRLNADYLLYSDTPLPCKNYISSLSPFMIHSFLTQLSMERLERKTDDIFRHLKRSLNSWDETTYVILSRSFGFGLNADAFESLARSLPFIYLQKHSDNLLQLEALLFGQAGLLEGTCDDDYFLQLQKEYLFLKKKYLLQAREGFLMRRMRIRPHSFPHLRIAQLAALLHRSGRLFSTMLDEEDPDRLLAHLRAEPSPYWQTHYSFAKRSRHTSKQLGESSLRILLINSVLPLLFAYGKRTANPLYGDRALSMLERLKPESNAIVTEFKNAGIIPRNAADTQALIQLRRAYCEKRNCLCCRIGHAILSSRTL